MKRSLLIVMYFSFLFAAACGGEEEKNLCDDVTCDAGICELNSGECINAPNCGADDKACLVGYECKSDTNICAPIVACDIANPCSRGTCVDNEVCVNPTACNTNANCLDGFYCTDDNVCSNDKCAEKTCDRGVCEIGSGGACVNADFCRVETQAQDCLEGFGCVGGSCVNEMNYCDTLDCKRGECSFESQACIDAEACGGDDLKCLAGNYCDKADNKCKANRCDVLGTSCDRGVCDPAQGVCIDVEQCKKSNECLDGKVCLAGACTDVADACGTAGCTGNQECKFTEATLMAACEENATGCASAVDCKDDRVCTKGACAMPGMCAVDVLEPNNTNAEAVDLTTALKELTLCDSDVDVFAFDTTKDADETGQLNVVLEIEPADVGLGELKIELIRGNTNLVAATASNIVNGVPTAKIDMNHMIDIVTKGKYLIKVSGVGVSTAGIRYNLRADVVDPAILSACNATTAIDTMAPTTRNTSTGTSFALKTCADTDGLLKENIFSLQIDKPSYVTLRALPAIDVDVVISLRSLCAQDGTMTACANKNAESDPEQIEAPLEPGTYFVVVESPSGKEGAYSIITTLEDIICTPADNNCADANSANVCNAKGSAFESEACENGCDMAAGRCTRDPGDVCETAIPLVGGKYSGTVEWTSFTGDYAPAAACVPEGADGSEAGGEDVVYAVTVPDGSALLATLDRDLGVYVSMYFVSSCQDVDAACLVGANAGKFDDETLFYKNDSGADISGFLIVDRGVSSTQSTPTKIDISVAPVVCTPGEGRCVLNRESQTCNIAGTAFDSSTTCNFGCDNTTGECVTAFNDVCGGALVLNSGVPVTGDISIFASSYNNDGCSGSSGGKDAVYLLQNVPVGSLIHVELDATFDSVVWMARTCTMDVLDSCVARADSGNPETLDFIAPDTGDYYIIAAAWSSSLAAGTYSLTATVAPPQCNAGELLGCSNATTLQYCNTTGQIEDLVCVGGCANDACGTPAGDLCQDAKALTPTTNLQIESGETFGNAAGSNTMGLSNNVGECSFSSKLDESDSFFTVDIPPQTSLEINFAPGFYPILFLLDETCSASSCKQDLDKSGKVDYFSAAGETVIIGVDAPDHSTFTTDYNEWIFTYRFIPQPNRICNPGDRRQCTGSVAELCSQDFTAFDSYACPSGCTDGLCDDDPALSQTCATAPDVTGGFIGFIDPTEYTNDVDGACGTNSDGNDAHFQVTLQPNEIVHVQVAGGYWFPQAYIYSDCTDPIASCKVGSPYSSSSEIFYQASTTETLFIGIDNESPNANSASHTAEVLIKVLQPECINGQAPICNPAGDGLSYCEKGFVKNLACGGNGVCSNDACENPAGDACFDVVQLDGTTPAGPINIASTFSGAIQGFGAVEKTIAGACRFSQTTSTSNLKDRLFQIPLTQGDRLKITHSGSTDTYVALVDDCTDANTCLAANRLAVEDVEIEFVAQATKDYTLVFRAEGSSTTSFSFDYEVISGSNYVCNPDSFYCLDATTVAACDANGQIRSQYTCPQGCMNGACTSSAATCGVAPTLTGGGYFIEYLDNGSDDVNLPTTSCANNDTPGSDYFYAVDLGVNDILDLRVQAFDGGDDPAIYIFTDCTDAANSCLAGQANGDNAQTLSYQSPVAQRVYVALDTESSSDSSWIALEMEVRQPECTPGVIANSCLADSTGFQYCNPTGFFDNYVCQNGGTCDATTVRCSDPVGDACIDPHVATPAAVATSEIFEGTLTGTDDYSLETGNQCTGSLTPAKDQVYAVDLSVGQVLTASLVSTVVGSEEDLAMYLTADCSDVPNSCLAGSDTQPNGTMPETMTYTATADETVYIIVDSFFGNASGTFALTVEIN